MFMAKNYERNGLSRSHLHHNGRRGVDHVYFVMPNQQYSQLQNIYLQCGLFLTHLLGNTYPNTKWPFFTVFNFQEKTYTEHV
jgi:hypothetical protein